MVVVGVSDLFPTVIRFNRPFLVLDLEAYLAYLKVLPPTSANTSPREIWLSLDSGQDRDALIAEITSELPLLATISDRQGEAASAARNPLAGGGWNGLTGLSMAGIGIAVVTALFLYTSASVRAARLDTAVARAVGLSSGQLILSMVAEKFLLGGAAIAVGAAIGYWPGLQLVQLLDLTYNSASAVPPMIPSVHSQLLAFVLIGLSATVIVSAAFAALLGERVSAVEVLREGT